MPKSSKTDLLLETLISEFKSLKETLVNKRETVVVAKEPIREIPPDPEKNIVPIPVYPVPLEYNKLVNDILNKSFGVRITPRSDAPLLEFSIIVPDKYSNMPPAQREVMKEDIRPKVITMAEGVNGVKDWCERVYKNFNPEIQAMIVADRNG